MYNKGLNNHIKFRTKYWQERHQNNLLTLEDAAITGIKIAPRLPSSRHNPEQTHKKSHSPPHLLKPSIDHQLPNTHYKLQLKLQLRSLDDDQFSALREGIRSVQITRRTNRQLNSQSRDRRAYRGKSQLEKKRQNRKDKSWMSGVDSMTLQLDRGAAHRIKHRFSLLENKHVGQFMPLGSSRYKQISTPLI